MLFFWFMFVCNLIYPLCMIIGGRQMWKHHSVNINPHVGYRSKRSKKNQDTWVFANENCGRRWWIVGWIMLIPTVLIQIPFYGLDDKIIGRLSLVICIIDCTILLVSILPTERALKENFNEDGTRKV